MDGKSKDLTQTYIEQLKALFPEVVTEVADKEGNKISRKVDMEKLALLLGEVALPSDEADYRQKYGEKFTFEWAGKRRAIAEAQKRSTGTLRPCPEDSVDWDLTENLYIEGDNLEVLKLLQDSYLGAVKMIYIDPPYNTGKDFVYKDNYKDNLTNYLEMTNTTNAVNSEASGRYHTNWLNMMYPRLKLARNLLSDDGVIFISIDDNEVSNLKTICDEIFGEDNFIGCAGRISKKANNQGDYWAPNFDYLLTYTKNIHYCAPFFGGMNSESYNLIEDSGERIGEKYQLLRLYMTSLDSMRGCTNQRYFIECPDGSFVIPPGEVFPSEKKDAANIAPASGKDKVWRWSYQSYLEKKDRIVVKNVKSSNLVDDNGNETHWNVFVKTYLNDVINNSTACPNSFIENHINQKATHELNSLDIPFDFAKPTSLVKFLAETCRVEKEDIVLDFFSGSATTAHAVMKLNAEDGGNRKFICVQLPEPTPEGSEAHKFLTELHKPTIIPEIAKERIRRAGKKIVEEQKAKAEKEGGLFSNTEEQHKLDIGFKVFKLDRSNVKEWDVEFDGLNEKQAAEALSLEFNKAMDILKDGRTEQDLLYEVMLKLGLPLSTKVENKA